jgi:hypothetical protein
MKREKNTFVEEMQAAMKRIWPDTLALLRGSGWMVAVHNDYRLNGVNHTFWLLTKGNRFIKGEGLTDEEALDSAFDQIPRRRGCLP